MGQGGEVGRHPLVRINQNFRNGEHSREPVEGLKDKLWSSVQRVFVWVCICLGLCLSVFLFFWVCVCLCFSFKEAWRAWRAWRAWSWSVCALVGVVAFYDPTFPMLKRPAAGARGSTDAQAVMVSW